jgi:predicted dehydrogenase
MPVNNNVIPKLRIGLIGAGQFGEKRGLAVQRSGRAALVAVADADAGRAKALAGKIGAASATVDALIASAETQALIIATPNGTHRDLAIRALQTGKHVLVEKPLACTADDARAIVKAAHEAERVVKYGCNTRFFSGVRKASEIVTQGTLGGIRTVSGFIGVNGGRMKGSWLEDPAQAGGGVLIDSGHHLLDLACWLLPGLEPVAGSRSSAPGRAVEDHAVALLSGSDGSTAILEFSRRWPGGYLHVKFECTDGFLTLGSLTGGNTDLVAWARTGQPVQTIEFPAAAQNSLSQEIEEFAACIQEGRTPEPQAGEGVRVLEIVEQVYRLAPIRHSTH